MNNNFEYAAKDGHLGLRLPQSLIGALKVKAMLLGYKNVSQYIRELVVKEVQNETT